MRRKSTAVVLLLLGVIALRQTGIAQQSATEAPAGFDTPTLADNAGSLTLQDAIERHLGEAKHVSRRFRDLSPAETQQLFTFLDSL